jgi:hypothetical protein
MEPIDEEKELQHTHHHHHDEESVVEMATTRNTGTWKPMSYADNEDGHGEKKYYSPCGLRELIGVAFLIVLNTGIRSLNRNPNDAGMEMPVVYQCPDPEQVGDINLDSRFVNEYTSETNNFSDNMTEFSATFRESRFDGWGRKYFKVKEAMKPWKLKHYPKYLKNGASIYESACGIGLNLFMTLEILQEAGILENDLVVYGNEYLDVSAAKANKILDQIAPSNGRKGLICRGDSTDLGFVPADSFDLVFTGYLRYVGENDACSKCSSYFLFPFSLFVLAHACSRL